MHVPAGHRFPDATGVAFASAWACHRCLQVYYLFVINTHICYILYSAFLGTQSTLHCDGDLFNHHQIIHLILKLS